MTTRCCLWVRAWGISMTNYVSLLTQRKELRWAQSGGSATRNSMLHFYEVLISQSGWKHHRGVRNREAANAFILLSLISRRIHLRDGAKTLKWIFICWDTADLLRNEQTIAVRGGSPLSFAFTHPKANWGSYPLTFFSVTIFSLHSSVFVEFTLVLGH